MVPAMNGKVEQFVFSMAMIPFLVMPASAKDSEQAIKAGEMVVTATRTEERPIDIPVTTQVMIASGLRNIAPPPGTPSVAPRSTNAM